MPAIHDENARPRTVPSGKRPLSEPSRSRALQAKGLENRPLKPAGESKSELKKGTSARAALAPITNAQRPLAANPMKPASSGSAGAQLAAMRRMAAQTSRPRTKTPPPKTPAAQIGAVGARNAALKARIAEKHGFDAPRVETVQRPKTQRSISVRPDEVTADRRMIDVPYRPVSPPKSKKGAELYKNVFGSSAAMTFEPNDFNFARPSLPDLPDFDPPSPRFGAFGGDDFKFDL